MTTYNIGKVKAKDLKLADVIRVFEGPWNTAIVKQVTEDAVTLFRPYGTTADFESTGGVICYTGIEDYQIYRNDFEYEVLQRTELK